MSKYFFRLSVAVRVRGHFRARTVCNLLLNRTLNLKISGGNLEQKKKIVLQDPIKNSKIPVFFLS